MSDIEHSTPKPAVAAGRDRHVAVWIDPHEARVFQFNAGLHKATIHPKRPTAEAPRKTGPAAAGQVVGDIGYMRNVASALTDADAILIVGPAAATSELVKYLRHNDPKTAERVIGVESRDHPTDGQLIARARALFYRPKGLISA